MPEAIKVLGQANPTGAVLTDLYTVPGATATTASTLSMCNRTGVNKNVRVSVAVAGAADSVEQYIVYDQKLLKNDAVFMTIGLTLAATDVVRVYTDVVGVSFALFGVELT